MDTECSLRTLFTSARVTLVEAVDSSEDDDEEEEEDDDEEEGIFECVNAAGSKGINAFLVLGVRSAEQMFALFELFFSLLISGRLFSVFALLAHFLLRENRSRECLGTNNES